ncbi:DNA-binding transcriptional regulator, GntR family [Thioclava dalianensis]|nr:DNA-binding transcriptional regulator, GntR family [Thioclava dalianensis]
MSAQHPREMLNLSAAVSPQVFRLLRNRIIRGDLEPGTRLSEAEIGAEYEVSRQPVREAFIKLADEGLLEIRPQRGTFVRKIAVSAVMDARFVREAIEADVVKLLAMTGNPALHRELRTQIAAQRERVEAGDNLGFMELDERFHRTLAEAADKHHAWSMVETIKSQMDRVRYLSTKRFPMENLVHQHAEVVAALERENPAEAEAAMRQHLQAILSDLPDIVEDKPTYFDASERI